MLHNLEAEIVRKKLKRKEVADFIGISTRTLYDKINGVSQFSTKEAFSLQKEFFPECSLDYLFEQTEK